MFLEALIIVAVIIIFVAFALAVLVVLAIVYRDNTVALEALTHLGKIGQGAITIAEKLSEPADED